MMDSRSRFNVAKKRRKLDRIRCKDTWMRYATALSSFVLGRHGRSRRLPVKDLSRGGLCFFSHEPLKLNREIDIQLELFPGRKPLTMRGQVRHVSMGKSSYPYSIGVAFTHMSRTTWCLLYDFQKKADKKQKIKQEESAEQDLFARTRAGLALKKWRLIEKWEGCDSAWIKGFTINRAWRFLWVAEGAYMNFFSIAIHRKGRDDTRLRPVNEHHLDGVKEGIVYVNLQGLLSLNVVAGGPGPVRWLIVVPDVT